MESVHPESAAMSAQEELTRAEEPAHEERESVEAIPESPADLPTESALGGLSYIAHTEPEEAAPAHLPDADEAIREETEGPIATAPAIETPVAMAGGGPVAGEETVPSTSSTEPAHSTPEEVPALLVAAAPAGAIETPVTSGPILGVPAELVTAASSRPIDKFIALVWEDIALMAGNTFAGRRGVAMEILQITPTGVQRKTPKGTTTEIPRTGIEWAIKQLYRNGELSRSKMTESLKENGSTIASGVFAILGQSRFFEATENPLTLHFYKLQWEEELY